MISCAICGCNDHHACDGGCFWVFTFSDAPQGLCSACVFNQLKAAAIESGPAAQHHLVGRLMLLAGELRAGAVGVLSPALVDGGASAGVEDHFDRFADEED